jgi:hypothetical protein
MIICIVTIYRNENPGSVLQAYALQKTLSNMQHRVVFYKHIIKSHTVRKMLLRIAKSIALLKLGKTAQIVRQFISYSKAHRLFKEISPDRLPNMNVDCYILGSDTIWNMEVKTLKEKLHFFGLPFIGKKIITYAASAANTTAEQIAQQGLVSGSLDHIQHISVRDEHTKNLIRPLTSKPVVLTCDPTLLLSADDYGTFENADPLKGKYILVYIYDKLSDAAIAELQGFAKRLSLKIIFFSKSLNSIKGKVIPKDPWTFITYYKHADYIITDTFHGSVFSIIFQKQFVSVQRGKNKVNDLLKRFKLSHRIAEDKEELIAVLERSMDWTVPNAALSDMREQSLEFLCSALAESVKIEE